MMGQCYSTNCDDLHTTVAWHCTAYWSCAQAVFDALNYMFLVLDEITGRTSVTWTRVRVSVSDSGAGA